MKCKKDNILLRFLKNLLLSSLIFFQSINIYADAAGTLVSDLITGATTVSDGLKKMFVGLGCDQLDGPTLIGMLPVSYTTSASLNSKGIMNMLAGVVSKDSICARNLIEFKIAMLSFDIAYKIWDNFRNSDPDKPWKVAIEYGALATWAGAISYAVLNVLSRYAQGQVAANDANICFDGDGNSPMPYTDSQMRTLLADANLTFTAANINKFNNKLCVSYQGTQYWLADGECTSDPDRPICVEHVTGYMNVLCAISPVGCPCIANIQRGIYAIPTFKTNSDGVIERDSEGNPQFEVDPSEYGNRFLKNCRISRVGVTGYQITNETKGIIDETCVNLKGHSKRKLSITGGICECMGNTARNIFEKPIFANVFKSKNTNALYQKTNDTYNADLANVLFYQKNINNIAGGKPFSALSVSDKEKVVSQVKSFLNFQTTEICYSKIAQSTTNNNLQKNFISKYSTLGFDQVCRLPNATDSSSGPTMACVIDTTVNGQNTILNQMSGIIAQNCYSNVISDKFINTEKEAILLLNSLINYSSGSTDNVIASQQDLNALFNSIYDSIESKKKSNDYINSLYAQADAGGSDILTWSLFDKFNNQIKFLSVFILTIWLCILGYRILMNEIKLNTSELTSLAMQVGLFYYIVIADFWKTFLFGFVVSISQGIGMAALDIGDIAGQYSNASCNYDAAKKTAVTSTVVTCDAGYTLYCQTKSSSGNCTSGQCVKTSDIKNNILVSVASCDTGYSLICSNKNSNGECTSGSCGKTSAGSVAALVNGIATCSGGYTLDCKTKNANNECTAGICYQDTYIINANYLNIASCEAGYTKECKSTSLNGNCTSALCYLNATTVLPRETTALTCDDGTNIQYKLECSRSDKKGVCIEHQCIQENSYIVKPNYEYPYIPVQYYKSYGSSPVSCAPSGETSAGSGWYDIPVCCRNANGLIKDASKILNSELGRYVLYCPDEGYMLDEGYTLSTLNKIFGMTGGSNVIAGFNQGDVVYSALKRTDSKGMIYPVAVIQNLDKDEVNKRVANASDIESKRSDLNKNRSYPVLKLTYDSRNTVIRDTSYLKFFDRLDCRIMRFLFIGLGSPGTTDIDVNSMDVGSFTQGILSAVKMIFGFFPFGIFVFVLMLFIAMTLFVVALRAVQSYIVGLFGLVMHAYTSPFFFMMSLFPSFKGARDTAIKNILSYAIVPPLGFLSLGLYFFILDIAFFGNPANYANLFDANGLVRGDCFDNDPSNAPLACIVNKVLSKINPDQAYATLVLNIALGMYAGTWAVVGNTLLSSLFGITDTIQLFLPFISKLAMALLLIVGGLSVMDTVEETVQSLIGMKTDTKTGSFLDGGVKDVTFGMFKTVSSFFG